MPCLHEVCTAFFLFKAFQPLLVTYLHTVVLETLILWSWSFLFTFQSCWIITHILTAFSITFLIQFVKQRPSTPWSFLGLSSNVFTFDHLFTHCSDLFNNLAISLTKWTEYRQHRCLSSSTNSVGLHFHERVEKIKEKGRNTKTENLQNGQEKYCGKKTRVRAHFEQKLKNVIFSSNFSLKLLWTVI